MLIEHNHSEPFSHQAIAMNDEEYEIFHNTRIKVIDGQKAIIRDYGKCYNLTGFISKRYILENY